MPRWLNDRWDPEHGVGSGLVALSVTNSLRAPVPGSLSSVFTSCSVPGPALLSPLSFDSVPCKSCVLWSFPRGSRKNKKVSLNSLPWWGLLLFSGPAMTTRPMVGFPNLRGGSPLGLHVPHPYPRADTAFPACGNRQWQTLSGLSAPAMVGWGGRVPEGRWLIFLGWWGTGETRHERGWWLRGRWGGAFWLNRGACKDTMGKYVWGPYRRHTSEPPWAETHGLGPQRQRNPAVLIECVGVLSWGPGREGGGGLGGRWPCHPKDRERGCSSACRRINDKP